VTAERGGLGPLGRRLLAAFVLVALTSVAVLTVAALIGTARGLTAGEDARRQAAADATATAVGDAYRAVGGWAGAELGRAYGIAEAAGAGLVVRDADGAPISGAMGMPQGMGMGGAGRGGVVSAIVVDGVEIGSVRLGFGSPATSTAQSVAWTWILVAAGVSLIVAFLVAWYVSRRISHPLVRLSNAARAFAAGDRAARADAADAAAPGELGDLARAFDATADDVVRSEVTRRNMAADVAHELRTPLAALQAGLEELRDGLVEPDGERLAALHAQSVRLARVVQDLADLSAAEMASVSMRRDLLDLGTLTADAVLAARRALDAAGIGVSTDLAPGVMVVGDPDRLHQAIGNLLGNAARYCRPGDAVHVRLASDAPWAVLDIVDTGPGIDPSDVPRVFERMWRGSADRQVPGSGIGLAVVRELVAAHGGVVEARSDGTSGTTFTVRLPIAGATG
jgi:two-component system, OmpR family, sensor histidine kinase BaeS